MPTRPQAGSNDPSIAEIEAGLRVVGRLAMDDPVYLPIFERLLEERAKSMSQEALLAAAQEWAA